jgi:hypothetical protein
MPSVEPKFVPFTVAPDFPAVEKEYVVKKAISSRLTNLVHIGTSDASVLIGVARPAPLVI